MIRDQATTFLRIRRPLEGCDKILLFCHGFPGVNRLAKLEKSLESKMSLIEINYRVDKASSGHFSLQGCVEDIRKTVRTLQEQYQLPIYALGYSAGGCYVLNAQRNEPNLFQEIVLLNPLVDTSFFVSSPLVPDLWQSAKKILSLKSPDFYQEEITVFRNQHNPMDFAVEITAPVALIQSREDEVLPPKSAQDFFLKLKSRKQWRWISNKGHDLDGGENEIRELLNFKW